MPDLNFDDDQDQSELFDEDNYDASSGGISSERRTFEEIPDVLDVTQAAGDADDDAALIGEEMDDDDIIELELDFDGADIEDDELRGRMPEAFDNDALGIDDAEEVYHAQEEGLDNREGGHGRFGGGDEVELIDAGDLNEVNVRQQRDLTALEAREVSDEDLEALGYAERGPDGTVRAKN